MISNNDECIPSYEIWKIFQNYLVTYLKCDLDGLFSTCCNDEHLARTQMGELIKSSYVCFNEIQLTAREENLKKLKMDFQNYRWVFCSPQNNQGLCIQNFNEVLLWG